MFPSNSDAGLIQDRPPRKWSTMNKPDVLAAFLQHRISSIMAKEWWDFAVNANDLNTHASLLYAVANLCPSFQYFMKTRDKEIGYVLKKRPVIKPRIFSGSERPAAPSSPPKETPLQKRNSSAELEKILNELYLNDNSINSNKSRLSGPASKQRKTPTEKFQSANALAQKNSIEGTDINETTLKKLLREEDVPVTALTITNRVPDTHKPKHSSKNHSGSLKEHRNKKVEYTVSDYDLNKNKVSMNIKKVKKIKKKFKKKIYFYKDKSSSVKALLEDETPELKFDLIQKHKIKKCSVILKKLSKKQIEEATKPRLKSLPVIFDDDSATLAGNELCKSLERTNILLPPVIIGPKSFKNSRPSLDEVATHSDRGIVKTTPVEQLCPSKGSLNNVAPHSSLVTPNKGKAVPEVNSQPMCNTSEKGSDSSNISPAIKYRSNQKENVEIVEKYKPKELKDLKTVYCHGGIVPLGKKVSASDKLLEKNKHFLSLKEKKVKDSVTESTDCVSPLKEKNAQSVNNESKSLVNTLPLLKKSGKNSDQLNITPEKLTTESVIELNQGTRSEEVLENIVNTQSLDSSIRKEALVISDAVVQIDNYSSDEEDLLDNRLVIDESPEKADENVGLQEENIGSQEIIVKDSQDDIEPNASEDVLKENESREKEVKVEIFEITDQFPNIRSLNGEKLAGKKLITKVSVINPSDADNDEELSEPSPKRPRIEINLTEMKIEVKKSSPEIDNLNEDFNCRVCKQTFCSLSDWLSHFDNEVPKCTPNLQVTWDRPEVVMLN